MRIITVLVRDYARVRRRAFFSSQKSYLPREQLPSRKVLSWKCISVRSRSVFILKLHDRNLGLWLGALTNLISTCVRFAFNSRSSEKKHFSRGVRECERRVCRSTYTHEIPHEYNAISNYKQDRLGKLITQLSSSLSLKFHLRVL